MLIARSRLVTKRRGADKRWLTFPVAVDDLMVRTLATSIPGAVRVKLDGDSVGRADPTGHVEAFYSPRYKNVRGISLYGADVVVHLGPRSLYIYSNSESPESLAALRRIESLLWSARRRSASLVEASWRYVLLAMTAFLVGASIFGMHHPRYVLAAVSVSVVVVIHFVGYMYAVLTRVRIDLWREKGQGALGGHGAMIAATIVAGVLGAVVGKLVEMFFAGPA